MFIEEGQLVTGSSCISALFDVNILLLQLFGDVVGDDFLCVKGFFIKAEKTLLVSSLLESAMKKNISLT